MMSTILTSVLNFCFASVPTCEYIDYVLLCRPVDETAQPWFFIEAGCIMIFSGEFLLRLLCCPATVGLVDFCRNPANVVDLVRPDSSARDSSAPQPELAPPPVPQPLPAPAQTSGTARAQ